MQEKKGIILTGIVVGLLSVALVKLGNPANMGYCVACFLRDIAGSLGLHQAKVVQYMRPEILGMVLGAFGAAFAAKEFSARAGSSPLIRFALGAVVMIGALMFLGCPLRMVLRLAGGDLNALFGIAGFTSGIVAGIFFLNRGFSLKRNYKVPDAAGYGFPVLILVLLGILLGAPTLLIFSAEGPGAMHAPVLIALGSGLAVGVMAQRTRLCMVGGIRDLILFKDTYLISGFIAIFIAAFLGNLFLGSFHLGFVKQPIAHADGLWNFAGMLLAGWGSVLLGGCPLRQLIMAGEGNVDSVMTVLGLVFGAALAHNFGLASSAKGPTPNGQIAVLACLLLLGVIALVKSEILTKKSKGDAANA